MRTFWRAALFTGLFFLLVEGIRGIGPLTKTGTLAWADNAAVSLFYEPLLPYGEWILARPYGWVWSPHHVRVNWRPYTNGRWILTDYGWTWVSAERWGWACFHYGRWFFHNTYGWVWSPGTVWAPAWVVWRYSDDWIGWAPLPPEVGWNDYFGLDTAGVDFDSIIPWFAFSFCEERNFLNDKLDRYTILPTRNVTILKKTRLFVNIGREGDRTVNRLPVEERLTQTLGHPVTHYKIADADSPSATPFQDNRLNVFRPNPGTSGEEGTRIAPTPETDNNRKPPELIKRQQEDVKLLQREQNLRKRTLEEEQNLEMQRPPRGVTTKELNQQHQVERRAFNEETNQESKILRNWHNHEQMTYESSSSGGRKYDFPGPESNGSVRSKKKQTN